MEVYSKWMIWLTYVFYKFFTIPFSMTILIIIRIKAEDTGKFYVLFFFSQYDWIFKIELIYIQLN